MSCEYRAVDESLRPSPESSRESQGPSLESSPESGRLSCTFSAIFPSVNSKLSRPQPEKQQISVLGSIQNI